MPRRMNLSTLRRAPRLLATDFLHSRRPPVYVGGLARSGTSWLAKTLSTASGVRYFREPFNYAFQPEATPFHFRHLAADDEDAAFDRFLRAALAGRLDGPKLRQAFWQRHQQYGWWPSRTLVKDVHTLLALARIERLSGARIVVIARHPCAVAESWRRLHQRDPDDHLFGELDAHLAILDAQGLLAPLRSAGLAEPATYLEKMGALWGAAHAVVARQLDDHPHWHLVHHEALCAHPADEFRRLFDALHLEWTPQTTDLLARSTRTPSAKPYATSRVSSQEADKWTRRLSSGEADEVMRFAHPFGLEALLAALSP